MFVWYGLRREDIVGKYAPWAKAFITDDALVEAIACNIATCDQTGAVSLRIVEDARSTNHWVACMRIGQRHGDNHEEMEADDATMTFEAIYLSLGRVVIKTIADGDCGLNVMTLILGRRRLKEIRNSLRLELCAYALKHAGNRAFIAGLFSLGETSEHLGLFELEAAGAKLFEVEPSTSDICSAGRHGDGEITPRVYSVEEVRAMTWKRRLHKFSPEGVRNVLRGLPEWCIQEAVTEYNNRDALTPPKKESRLLVVTRSKHH